MSVPNSVRKFYNAPFLSESETFLKSINSWYIDIDIDFDIC
jgi:hypothetical protein